MIYLMEYLDFRDIDDINYDNCDNYPEFKGHDKFCRFLVNEGLIDKFIHNYKFNNNFGIGIKDYLDRVGDYFYISSIFKWGDDVGGREYWNIINNKWREQLKGDH
jgi:hypothetical protein